MSNAMHVAKTGLNAQNKRMQVISNNLANVNTKDLKEIGQTSSHFYTKF